MGRRGMPGRRRQVVQLDENTKTSYLTQTGCYRPDDMFVESKNSVRTGLSFIGEYSDSESDSEGEAEQTDPDVESKLNGDTPMKGEESQPVKENNESLQAEMLEIVGVKKETSADIFLREFQACQKESVAPVYNREFIAFQKESKENVESSPTSSLKDAQKENSTKSSEDASSVTKTDTASSSGIKTPDIDSQVASFLAEIDALGDEEEKEKEKEKVEESNEIGISDSSSVDREQNVQSSMTVSDPKNKDPLNGNSATTGTSKTAQEEVEENAPAPLPPQEEKIVWPEEPTTEWQQCYDENTQHCYYWNINTNEVTWEIPAEFTQYLLLYREYEEKITKLMKDGKTKPRKKKPQKKSEKSKVKQSENESETSSKDSNAEPQVEYGPHLPPSSDNQKDTCSSPPETAGPAPVGQESSKESMEPMYGPMLKPDTPPEGNKEKGEESDASSSSSTGKCMHNTAGDNVEVEEKDNNITDNKKPAAAASTTSVTDTGSPADSTAAETVSTTSVNEGSTGDSLTADLALMELCKKKFKARMSREEESGKSSVSLSVDSGAKDNPLPTDFEEGLLDIDEVDRELELALERKKNELKCLEEEEEKQSHESVKVRGKRKHHNDRASEDSSADEVSPQKSSKRSRDQRSRDHKESSKHSKKVKHKKDDTNGISSDGSSPPSTTSKKSRSSDQKKSHRSHQSKKESRPKKVKEMPSSKEHVDSKSRSCDDTEENKLKESALDLSQLVMDKMDFLEIDVSKQSKLQVLYVQLKTRISDWHAGGLATKYFYVKLQEANQQLGQYEKSGAPAGWSVNWDRTCKRYFYTNNTTGHSQWEYPDQPPKEEGNELPDTLGSMAGPLPLPLLPPPPPPRSPSPSPSALEKTQEASEKVDKEHQKVAKECERPNRSSSEKEKYSSSKSEGRKEKRSRKESKSSKSSRSKDSSKSKSHSENSTSSKLKNYDCEMSIYPGEPPPPGTEPSLQPPATTVSSASIGQTNSPQLDNKNPLKLAQTVEDDLEDVMNLAASLSKPATVCTSACGVTDDIDDMEIDPEDEVATPVPLFPSADFKINSANAGSNGTIVSVQDAVGSHNANSSAVISKPPHLTRPALGVESLPVSAVSGLESTQSYGGRMEAIVSDAPIMSHSILSSLPELPNESSNSPKPTDNNEATEAIKTPKEKKKKKDKVITGTSLTLKKKNVSSLVQKWQKVKKEVEKEDELARHEFSDGD